MSYEHQEADVSVAGVRSSMGPTVRRPSEQSRPWRTNLSAQERRSWSVGMLAVVLEPPSTSRSGSMRGKWARGLGTDEWVSEHGIVSRRCWICLRAALAFHSAGASRAGMRTRASASCPRSHRLKIGRFSSAASSSVAAHRRSAPSVNDHLQCKPVQARKPRQPTPPYLTA